MSSHGAQETERLKNNIQDQLSRLLLQLQYVYIYKYHKYKLVDKDLNLVNILLLNNLHYILHLIPVFYYLIFFLILFLLNYPIYS